MRFHKSISYKKNNKIQIYQYKSDENQFLFIIFYTLHIYVNTKNCVLPSIQFHLNIQKRQLKRDHQFHFFFVSFHRNPMSK